LAVLAAMVLWPKEAAACRYCPPFGVLCRYQYAVGFANCGAVWTGHAPMTCQASGSCPEYGPPYFGGGGSDDDPCSAWSGIGPCPYYRAELERTDPAEIAIAEILPVPVRTGRVPERLIADR
jgi:hypothetical protein